VLISEANKYSQSVSQYKDVEYLGVSESYSPGGSRDAAVRCRHCSNLLLLLLLPEHVSEAEIGTGRKSSERERSDERASKNAVELEVAEIIGIQGGPNKWGHRLVATILSNLNRLKNSLESVREIV